MAKKRNEFSRKSGKRKALGEKKNRRLLSFNYTKRCVVQSQTFSDWQEDGLLSDLMDRMTHLCSFTVPQALAIKEITVYTKVVFPPKSGFIWPKHISDDVKWATFHVKPKSKEVVVGYLEEDIFYLVFLDKEHLFWKCELKNT